MKRYIDFIEGRFPAKKVGGKPSCIQAAMTRLALGMLVLSLFQIGTLLLPDRYLLSDDFVNGALWKKLLLIGIWGKISLYKYISCWLISEGSCILTGMTYNGQDENKNDLWNGCANVNFWDYSKVTTFDGVIRTFNINTNLWVAQYIFKRLKFVGSKLFSQGATLGFLAVWHGLHSGYYVCFFNEFAVMYTEKDVETFLKQRLPKLKQILSSGALKIPMFIIMKVYVDIFMGYCLVPFVLLSYDRYTKVYGSVYYMGHIIYLGWPVIAPLARMAFPRKDKAKAQ